MDGGARIARSVRGGAAWRRASGRSTASHRSRGGRRASRWARSLALIHDGDLMATGLDDLAGHAPYAERQLRRWSRHYEASKTRDLPLIGQLADRLSRAIPEQRDVRLVHGDFHLLNAIPDPARGEVRAVLDWELSTLGEPLADLGGLLAYWPGRPTQSVSGKRSVAGSLRSSAKACAVVPSRTPPTATPTGQAGQAT